LGNDLNINYPDNFKIYNNSPDLNQTFNLDKNGNITTNVSSINLTNTLNPSTSISAKGNLNINTNNYFGINGTDHLNINGELDINHAYTVYIDNPFSVNSNLYVDRNINSNGYYLGDPNSQFLSWTTDGNNAKLIDSDPDNNTIMSIDQNGNMDLTQNDSYQKYDLYLENYFEFSNNNINYYLYYSITTILNKLGIIEISKKLAIDTVGPAILNNSSVPGYLEVPNLFSYYDNYIGYLTTNNTTYHGNISYTDKLIFTKNGYIRDHSGTPHLHFDMDDSHNTTILHKSKTRINFMNNLANDSIPMSYDTKTDTLTINGDVYIDDQVTLANSSAGSPSTTNPIITGKIIDGSPSITSFIDTFNSIKTNNIQIFTY
jgi:hypothetical protein